MQSEVKWHQRPWVIIVLAIVFFPLGVFLIWHKASWGKTSKIVLTAIFGCFFAIAIAAGSTKTIWEKMDTERRQLARETEEQGQAEAATQRSRELEESWRTLLDNGTYQSLIESLASMRNDKNLATDRDLVRERDLTGPIVVISDGEGVYVPLAHNVDSYQRPVEALHTGYRLLSDIDTTLPNLSAIADASNGEALDVVIFAEYAGDDFVGTYTEVGAVYERVVRFYIIDITEEALLACYETTPLSYPQKLPYGMTNKLRAENGRLYLDTYSIENSAASGREDFMHIQRFFNEVLW
jgi:hypothetical protein